MTRKEGDLLYANRGPRILTFRTQRFEGSNETTNWTDSVADPHRFQCGSGIQGFDDQKF
jgi:hypothetical protein